MKIKSLMKDILGLETAFEINAKEDVIRFLLIEYLEKNQPEKDFVFSYKEFLMYLLDYGGSSIAIAHWVNEIYQSLTGDDI